MKPVIRTYLGREVNPLDLGVDDLEIESIAHSLALTNRFAGHTREPISVAQHSVYVAKLLARESIYLGLLGICHDMVEAFVGDVTKWVKHSPEMTAFRACETRGGELIYQTFLPRMPTEDERERLDWADRVMVRYEGQQGLGQSFIINSPRYPPLTAAEIDAIGPWYPWHWEHAETRFLQCYHELSAACVA